YQPVLATAGPIPPGMPCDPQVRLARFDEVDVVMPAAAAMFTEEIGYPPYRGSGQLYRQGIASMIRRGHTFVRVEDGEVVFKADVGSVALGVAQVQGVWVAPRRRGQGLAGPAMAAVVALVRAEIAPVVTLYVNDFNAPARATYARVGFTEIGSFATVLM
ncbi:MAG: GNAT family N-acetyltransferase, partial [Cryobacterium sp.]|nr:GNAT family N-acetyltransferase [Cryobacterium sp.]